jgi:hypothetical protein
MHNVILHKRVQISIQPFYNLQIGARAYAKISFWRISH